MFPCGASAVTIWPAVLAMRRQLADKPFPARTIT